MFQGMNFEKKHESLVFSKKNCKNGQREHSGFGKKSLFFTTRPVERDDYRKKIIKITSLGEVCRGKFDGGILENCP